MSGSRFFSLSFLSLKRNPKEARCLLDVLASLVGLHVPCPGLKQLPGSTFFQLPLTFSILALAACVPSFLLLFEQRPLTLLVDSSFLSRQRLLRLPSGFSSFFPFSLFFFFYFYMS